MLLENVMKTAKTQRTESSGEAHPELFALVRSEHPEVLHNRGGEPLLLRLLELGLRLLHLLSRGLLVLHLLVRRRHRLGRLRLLLPRPALRLPVRKHQWRSGQNTAQVFRLKSDSS